MKLEGIGRKQALKVSIGAIAVLICFFKHTFTALYSVFQYTIYYIVLAFFAIT